MGLSLGLDMSVSVSEGNGSRGAWSNIGNRDALDGDEMGRLERGGIPRGALEDWGCRVGRGPSVKSKMEHADAGSGTSAACTGHGHEHVLGTGSICRC